MTGRRQEEPPARVELTVHRSVTVIGTDDKPALELENRNGEVRVTRLPRNGQRREAVRLEDLDRAVQALKDGGRA